ncbi:hypothetical protein Riv7116_1858 [Rivularia sp. PCC 7116]|uniref:ATP-binding protein n=1 Tax=Rivularia sp. PCC 7116 TaxID=373994 RepID=UPI00029F1896|nr:ATP-binding protein [Rivularia sp. PCC 7116]AFY54399.1 hypothetical protein Riv7116_1858 [Rivularia sp. PCC 7116]
MIPELVLLGEVIISAPTPIRSARLEHPFKFEIPLVVGSILGAAAGGVLMASTTTESSRLQQSQVAEVEVEKELKVENERPIPNTQYPTPETETEILDFYNWDDLEDEAVGVLIFGNSGSAKTSLACWLAGKLTANKPAQVLALDPHANRNPLWRELGIKVLSDFTLIERQLEALENLLDLRREADYQPKEDDFLIVFTDELGACLKNFDDSTRVERTLERLGSEGRKYDIMFIAMNQSSNVEDIGISAQNRNNFVLILTGASAATYAESRWKQFDKRNQWIQQQAYPCVLTGAVRASIAIHPTDGDYKTFKKKGNPPIGINPINQLPLTISLADNDTPPELSSEAEKLLKWFNSKTVSPDSKFGIRNIQQSRPLGHKSHKNEAIKPIINELVENSLIEKDSEDNYQLVKTC